MFNRLGVRNEQRHTVRDDFASTSNSQQNSGLSNNETPGPSNVNANIQSTSGHSSSQNRDTFNNTVGGQNNGNLEIGDEPGENRFAAKDRILKCFQKRDTDLSLHNLNLRSLPEEIGNLTWLSELNLWENQLTALPDSFGNLTGLHTLGLDNNRLTTLPDSLGNLTRLRKLNLSSNQLTSLPDFIGNLTRLRTLDLRNNQLTALPQCIFRLPQETQISLEQNPLSQQTMAALTQLTQRTGGLRISFSIVETPAAQAPRSRGSSFENAIRHYCSNISPEYLHNLQGTENADYFCSLLNRRTAQPAL